MKLQYPIGQIEANIIFTVLYFCFKNITVLAIFCWFRCQNKRFSHLLRFVTLTPSIKICQNCSAHLFGEFEFLFALLMLCSFAEIFHFIVAAVAAVIRGPSVGHLGAGDWGVEAVAIKRFGEKLFVEHKHESSPSDQVSFITMIHFQILLFV